MYRLLASTRVQYLWLHHPFTLVSQIFYLIYIALSVPYSRVLGIKNIIQVNHKYSQKCACYGLDLVSDISG